ncbi:CaiB/BaiF CoA transferase family protein [Thermodesulfobacteriota bacterium]
MTDSLLNGYRGLDLTDAKGLFCGKILATIGVETIKIEKPEGDPAREDISSPRKSLYWETYNTNKRSITLNLENSRGQDLFKELIKTADFLLESFPPGYLDRIGLGYDDLCQINPGVVMTSITPFGQKGPYSHYKGCDLVISAMSGVMENTGYPDRPPLKESLEACYYIGNAAAAFGTILAHHYRQITGQGQQVDVSLQEVAVCRNSINLMLWEFEKRLIDRIGVGNRYGSVLVTSVWPCKDGHISWALFGGTLGADSNRALSQWIDDDGEDNPFREVTNWDELNLAEIGQEKVDDFEVAIGDFFMRHTKQEIAEEGLRRGINAAVINNPADILENIQLNSRDFWEEMQHPELGIALPYPKYFFLSNLTENFVKNRAPLIGEDNQAIYVNELGLSGTEIKSLKETGVI